MRRNTVFLVIFVLIAGVMIGWLLRVMRVGDSRTAPEPVQHLQSDLEVLFDTVNQRVEDANAQIIVSPPEISVTETYRYYIDQGELQGDRLDGFTGRIVAWNGTQGMDETDWPDRPGDGPDLSLYFHQGTLYYVEQAQGNLRMMFEQGKLRQATFYGWSTQSSTNASNTVTGEKGQHPFTSWRFDDEERIAHHTRISDSRINSEGPEWDANRMIWSGGYRTDWYYAQGQLEMLIKTGPDGKLHMLGYRHEDRWTNRVFDPQGQVVVEVESEPPGK